MAGMTLETLRKLVRLDDKDPLSRFALGRKLNEIASAGPVEDARATYEEAATHLRYANRAEPTHLATYHQLAIALIALGLHEEAAVVLQAGIERVSVVGEGMGRDLGPMMRQMLESIEADR